MHNPTYLTLSRNGVFHLRWPMPRKLHPEGKPSTIKFSLRTRDPREALRLSRYLSYAAHWIVTHGASEGMRYQDMRDTLHRHFSELLEAQQQRMADTGPLAPSDIAALETGRAVSLGAVSGRYSLSLVEDDTALLERFIEKYELPVEAGSHEYELLRKELPTAYRDFCTSVLAHNRSLASYDFNAKPVDGTPNKPTTETATLGDTIGKFIAEQVRTNRWAPRSEAQNRQHLEFIESYLGVHRGVDSITRKMAGDLKDTLLRLPKNMNKNPRTRGKTLDEILEMEHAERLSTRTVTMYLRTYSSLFGWAVSRGLVKENPFSGLGIKGNDRNQVDREAFTTEQLQRIETALLTEDPETAPKETHKWASLILIYTGARLNEICQLDVADIREHDGILCFDVNDEGDGKHLKNRSSIRTVPIHSRLIELGLMDYVERMRTKKAERLFPQFSYSKGYGGYGRNVSVWFNTKLLVRLGIKTKQLVLHSARHTMVTRLSQAGVEEPVVKGVVGHTQQGVTQQHYFKAGYTVSQLKEAIEKFQFPHVPS